MVASCSKDLLGLRDCALTLVGFAGAFRRSELARMATIHAQERFLTLWRFRVRIHRHCGQIQICQIGTIVEPPKMAEVFRSNERWLSSNSVPLLRQPSQECCKVFCRSRGFRRTAKQFSTGCVSQEAKRTFPPQPGFAAERAVATIPIVSNLQQSVRLII